MNDTFSFPVYGISAGYGNNCPNDSIMSADALDIDCNTFNLAANSTMRDYYDLYFNALALNQQGTPLTAVRNHFTQNRTCAVSNHHHIGFAPGSSGMDYYYITSPAANVKGDEQPVCNIAVSSFSSNPGSNPDSCIRSSYCKPGQFVEDTSGWQSNGHSDPGDPSDLDKADLYLEVIDNIFEKDFETGISRNDYEQQWVKSYPNPTTGLIKFDVSAISGSDMKLDIIDENGKIILKRQIQKGIMTYNADLSKLAKGVYFYKISSCRNTSVNGYGKIILK
jgi:hypothetical protein